MRKWKVPSVGLLLVASIISNTQSAAQISEDSQMCLACHEDEAAKDTRTEFKNGEGLPVHVDGKMFRNSVHGTFDCYDCHSEFSGEEHPTRTFQNRRTYALSLSEACQFCHDFGGIHLRMVNNHERLPCVDCHSPHSLQALDDSGESCLGCHQQELRMTLGDGSSFPLRIDSNVIEDSAHRKLRCVDCHFGFSSKEHPERIFQNQRDVTLVLTESCRRCHFDKYTKLLESVHYEILSQQDSSTPVCADCHGSHSIRSSPQDKQILASRCKSCHPTIYQAYSESVHGSALLSTGNQDVPICSDCHTAHQIKDPRLVDFRNEIPQMCGDCHANAELMSKYGLSTNVLESYLSDFHGVTLTFYKKQENPVRHIAVCTDCHGIHDIVSLRGRNDTLVKASLLERCQQCHPDATENFPDSWLSHYEPTITRAPLVYLVTLFYKFLIPLMIVGLGLQILLHIWRYAINR